MNGYKAWWKDTDRENISGITLSTTNPTNASVKLSPGNRSEKLATNLLRWQGPECVEPSVYPPYVFTVWCSMQHRYYSYQRTSCPSDAPCRRLTAQSAVTWTATASSCACSQSPRCVAGWQSTVCIIDRAIKYCCSWNVFPCNRLYRYRLLETPTDHNRYYKTETVLSFWSVHVKSFWCAVTSVVWLVQQWRQWCGWYSSDVSGVVGTTVTSVVWLVQQWRQWCGWYSQTRRQGRQCKCNVTSWSVRVTIVAVYKQKSVKYFQLVSIVASLLRLSGSNTFSHIVP